MNINAYLLNGGGGVKDQDYSLSRPDSSLLDNFLEMFRSWKRKHISLGI